MSKNKTFAAVLTTALGGAALAVYALFVRPWHLRWGATDEELKMSLPGDEQVEHLLPEARDEVLRQGLAPEGRAQKLPFRELRTAIRGSR